MAIEMDYYYNQESNNNNLSVLNIQDVINGKTDFLGCFIMTVNEKYILNDYKTYPENKQYNNSDWITWLGQQFMQSLIAFEKKVKSYSYIHFIEYSGGKGLEIFLDNCERVVINYVKSGINWYSFDKKIEGLEYYWNNEIISISEYREAIRLYCKKVYEEYNNLNQPIRADLYPDFEKKYTYLFLKSRD